jgi:hypothetical protein
MVRLIQTCFFTLSLLLAGCGAGTAAAQEPPSPEPPATFRTEQGAGLPAGQEPLPSLPGLSGEIGHLPFQDLIRFLGTKELLPLILFLLFYKGIPLIRTIYENMRKREDDLQERLRNVEQQNTDRLGQLALTLTSLERDFQQLHRQLEHHAEMIRNNGQISKDITLAMTQQTMTVSQELNDLTSRLNNVLTRGEKRK